MIKYYQIFSVKTLAFFKKQYFSFTNKMYYPCIKFIVIKKPLYNIIFM